MQGSSNQQSQPSGQQQQIAPPAQTNTPPQSQQGQQPRQQSTIDVPVRILVPSDSVGAIIGKGGQTIRQLTQQTRAKVDVYRGDPMAPTTVLQEKVITIRGQPENCINACREILKVMRADAESKGKPADFPLKVLAHNDYIGRIIGKQGNIINAIKKDTDTSVTVSSINDVSLNVERVITVKGDLENMIKALEIIHSKVKAAFENDTKTYGAQAILMGGIPPLSLTAPAFATAQSAAAAAAAAAALNSAPPTSAARFAAAAAAAAAVAAAAQQHVVPGTGAAAPLTGSSQAGAATPGQQNGSNGTPGAQVGANGSQTAVASSAAASGAPQAAAAYGSYYAPTIYHQVAGVHPGAGMSVGGAPGVDLMGVGATAEPETVYLYIPNVAVGAIIGTKGSYIKNIIKLSGASVKITPMSPEESKQAVERQVVITGSPDSQWRAQYYIYEKIKQERFTSDDNVKLRAELRVPSSIVGRIIGKSGKNVRELQRATGATIKLPEDIQGGNQGPHSASNEQQPSTENTNEQTESKTEVKSEETVETSETTPAPVVEATPVEQTPAENGVNHAGDEEQENKSVADNDEAEGENGAAANTSLNGKSQSGQSDNNKDFVTVRIFGTFHASQAAQRRILSLVTQSLVPQSSAAAAAAVAAVALQQQRSYNAGAAVASSPYSMHAMAPPMPILNYHGDRYMNAPPAHHHHQQAHHHHHGQQPQQHQYHHQGKTNGYGPRRNTSRPYGNNGKQQLDQQNHNTSLNGSAPTNDQQQQQQAPSHSPNVAQQPIAAN